MPPLSCSGLDLIGAALMGGWLNMLLLRQGRARPVALVHGAAESPGQIGLSQRAVAQIRRPRQFVTQRDGGKYYFGQGVVTIEPGNATW